MDDHDPFLAAVRAVPHRADCDSTYAGPKNNFGRISACNCDRDERIAKGLEAALEEGWFVAPLDDRTDTSDHEHFTDSGVRAFTEAAKP